jgi:hypothetical protein
MQTLKKIFSIYGLLLLQLTIGCETEQILFDDPYFVKFSEEGDTYRESFSKVIQIPVHLVGTTLPEDVSIRYSTSGTAREGVDFVILAEEKRVVIKSGEYFGYIPVQLINNANNILRSQTLVFHLESSDNPDVKVGHPNSEMGRTFTLTIFDDCILGGNYNGFQRGFSIPVEGITITSDDCETYTLSNWNIGIFNTPFDMDLTFVDNGDNTLTISQQEEEILPEDFATIKGTGTVDPVTREITFTVVLVDFEEQPEITFTLTPD